MSNHALKAIAAADKILSMAEIEHLPTAEQAKLHHFMGQLGKLIDVGKSDGIEVDYLNPLLDAMKRLSENVITYQPRPSPQVMDTPHE